MTKSVFSLQRLTESKKTMRAAAVVAMWSVATPVYSGGLTNFVKDIADRTTVYVFAESGDASLSPAQENKRGVAAIVYSPADRSHGQGSQSAFQVSQVADALGGKFTVADLTPTQQHTLNAKSKKEAKKYMGLSTGAWIGSLMLLLGIGYFVASTNDDGNRN